MKDIANYIFESLEIINESKNFTLSKCPGWSFSWISTKNQYAMKGDPKMSYHLVCTPNDKTKDIVVFRDFACYKGGYDQGHASSRKFYLVTITSGERGNGDGIERECEPFDYDLDLDAEHLNCYLNGKKDWSSHAAEALEKAANTYDIKTKISEIKQSFRF